jgi:phosphoserine phosphatase
MPKKKRKVAVFDIDGTVFRSSLLVELTNALIHAKIFPFSIKKSYGEAYRKWLERRGDYNTYISSVVKVFDAHIKGASLNDVRRVADRVAVMHKYHTYRYTRSLVGELKRKGYFLLAISHSPRTHFRTQ